MRTKEMISSQETSLISMVVFYYEVWISGSLEKSVFPF